MKKYRKPTELLQHVKKILTHAQFKSITFTIGAALCIGFIFGFIVLQMVSVEKDQTITDIETTSIKTDNNQQQKRLQEISLYIQQAGVFSEKENATDHAQLLEANQIPFVIREADEQYFIWMNPTLNESEAKTSAEKLEKENITTYVKKWEIPNTTLELEKAEMEWLQTYNSLLSVSLKEKRVNVDEWKPLLDEKLHTDYSNWQTTLQKIIENEHVSANQLLLQITTHYEKLVKGQNINNSK